MIQYEQNSNSLISSSRKRRRHRSMFSPCKARTTLGSYCCLLLAASCCPCHSLTPSDAATTSTTTWSSHHIEYKKRDSSSFLWSFRDWTLSRWLDEDDERDNDEKEEEEQEEEQREGEAEEEQQQQQEDEEDNDGDDQEAQEDDNDEGDQQQQDNDDDDNNNERNFQDDYFDDRIQDDLVADDDDYKTVKFDDFYAFDEDPGPPQLFPMRQRYILGFLAASMALTLGATGGIGGGGVVVPVYIIIMGLPLKVAVPIGAITVFGGALGSTLMNWTRRHPLADRPLIDWDLVLLMEPLTLVGTLVGTLFHRVFSERFLIVLLVLLLSATAHSTLSKAMRMYRAEIRYIRHLRTTTARPDSPSQSPSMMFSKTFSWDGVNSPTIKGLNSPRRLDNEEKQQILIQNPDFVTIRSELAEQEKFTPRGKIIAVITIFSVVVFLNVMVGGGAYESPWHIECGGTSFWVIHTIMLLFLIASAWAAQVYVVSRHEIKELVRFDYVHGDIKWDARSAIIYPTVFVMAGFFAGTLGIGGGVITVPIMLTMGVHPSVVSATSSTMILFTSFASTSSYLIFGLVLKDFATVGFGIGFFAALVGQTLMRQARQATSASGRNFERNSYVAFAIGGVVLISALLITVQFTFNILQEDDDYDGGLCDGLRF